MGFLGELSTAVTRIRIDPDSGILLQPGADPHRVRLIRAWNFLEPCVVFGKMMAVVWISMLDPAVWWLKPSLYALIAWVLVFSPLVHYPFEKDLFLTGAQRRHGLGFYFFECRGLGSPLRYFLPRDGEPPLLVKHWKTVLGLVLFIDLLFVCAFIQFNPEITERYAAHMRGSAIHAMLFRIGLLLVIDAGLVLVAFPFMLRLDNFRAGFRFIVLFMILIAMLALVGNLLFHLNEDSLRARFADNPYMSLRGERALERLFALRPIAVGAQWSGYVFWGFLQELLFLGVFSVQFSRAFDVGRSKLHLALACLCTACLFGLVHVPNFWLCVVTSIGGLFGSLYFMQCRNLFAFGIVHGFGGTITNKLLPINFSVGPSQVPH